MTPMEMYDQDWQLYDAHFATGDWRGAIAALQDARQRAGELGLFVFYSGCDSILAQLEIHLRKEAERLGVSVDQLGNWETTS
jgi:hypothetical protein